MIYSLFNDVFMVFAICLYGLVAVVVLATLAVRAAARKALEESAKLGHKPAQDAAKALATAAVKTTASVVAQRAFNAWAKAR